MKPCAFEYDDGGRAAAGFKGSAGDCVTRAVAIATERPYVEVYEAINTLARTVEGSRTEALVRKAMRLKGWDRSTARSGVTRKIYELYLKGHGWIFVPTMWIGSGCRIHLRADELPPGRIIARCSKHLTCVIDGVIHDTFDPSRAGTRAVYGYYTRGAR